MHENIKTTEQGKFGKGVCFHFKVLEDFLDCESLTAQ
jgi:hypothetical protein